MFNWAKDKSELLTWCKPIHLKPLHRYRKESKENPNYSPFQSSKVLPAEVKRKSLLTIQWLTTWEYICLLFLFIPDPTRRSRLSVPSWNSSEYPLPTSETLYPLEFTGHYQQKPYPWSFCLTETWLSKEGTTPISSVPSWTYIKWYVRVLFYLFVSSKSLPPPLSQNSPVLIMSDYLLVPVLKNLICPLIFQWF